MEGRDHFLCDLHLVNSTNLPQCRECCPSEENYQCQSNKLPVTEAQKFKYICICYLSHLFRNLLTVYQQNQQLFDTRAEPISQSLSSCSLIQIRLQKQRIQASRQYQMKDEILPEIPEENIAQTQSMYEQLRKTSQKWFNGSHRRIFTNSNFSSSKQSGKQKQQLSERAIQSNISEWEMPSDNSQKMKLVSMMRQQIEIGCEQYTSRLKGFIQDQAKKIKLLGDLLVKNQMELNRKNKIIQTLVKIVEAKSNVGSKVDVEAVNRKVLECDQSMLHIESKIELIKQNQAAISSKIKHIERQYREKLFKVSSEYSKKVHEISEQFQQRIDKIEKIMAMNQTQSKFHRRGSISQISLNNNIAKSMEYLVNELEELKVEVESFRKKKYRYENYKFQEVQNDINRIHSILEKYEKVTRLRTSPSGNLKSSQTTHMTRTQSNFDIQCSQTSKTRFLNKYKSLINTRQESNLRLKHKHSCSSESDSQSEVEQTYLQEESNIERLKRIVEEMNIKTPIRLQIDQTGYAKSTDTGMYFVDTLGNGFEFSPSEIKYLTANHIIIT